MGNVSPCGARIGSVVVAALLLAGPAGAQLGLSDKDRAPFEPAALVVPQRNRGQPVTSLRLRFYVDDEYRASTPRAQERIRQTLMLVNRVVEQAFGVRFDIESWKRWDRRAPAAQLQPVLQELEKHDAGAGVDWVVGLVAPLPLVSTSIHDLGMARIVGRHFVLRGMSSIEELDAFRRAFPMTARLGNDDVNALYSRRKQHKEVVIFLHEWLHTLGGIHVGDPRRVLCPTYSEKSSELTQIDVTMAAAALEDRLGARAQGKPVDWSHLRAVASKTRAPDWYTGERDALLADLAEMGKPAPPAPADQRLQPLVDRVNAAQALVSSEDRPGALVKTREIAAELAKLDRPPARFWIWVAQLHNQLGTVTEAEQALARTDKGPPLPAEDRSEQDKSRLEVQRTRRFLGLPAGEAAGVGPDRELGYAQTFLQARQLLVERKLPPARAAIEAGLQEYPRAPGLLTLSCELGLRQGRVREAARRCAAALAVMEELPHAHYLQGHAKMSAGDGPGAVAPLRRALALEPEEQVYRQSLVDLLKQLGRHKEAAALAAADAGAPPDVRPAETVERPPAEAAPPAPRRPFNPWAPIQPGQ